MIGSRKFEMHHERVVYRRAGSTTSAESYHRDESRAAASSDVIFGGWINVGVSDNFFSCVPGTHVALRPARGKGFAKITASEVSAQKYASRLRVVVVPPGHILVFYEHIVHIVHPATVKVGQEVLRQHLGWRITDSSFPLTADVDARISEQAVMPLKSGQMPPMYPTSYWNYPKQRDQLEVYSRLNISPRLLISRSPKQGLQAGRKYRVVPRYLPSSLKLGHLLQRAYSDDERQCYKPHSIVW